MELGIAGKIALVTASSGGMGLNVADALAAEGADLVLFARSADKLEVAAAAIAQKYGVQVHTQPGDMLDAADVRSLARRLEELGGPDIAVLLTARPPTPLRRTLEETDPTRWQTAYDNQLASVVHVVNGIIGLMAGREWGRIIAITSAHAKQPLAGHALSTVFRAGVTAYLKSLAIEVAPSRITVNCVAPALIDTSHRTGDAAYTPAQEEHRRNMSLLGRMGTQEEVSAAVAFLASRQAGFITGSTMTVDGGMVSALF